MKHALLAATFGAIISLAAASDAAAWSRGGSVTTWRGTYQVQASGACAGGTCSRSRSVTGPNGGTVSRTGSVTRTGPYRYTYSRTTTRPDGSSVTRSGTVRTRPYWVYRY